MKRRGRGAVELPTRAQVEQELRRLRRRWRYHRTLGQLVAVLLVTVAAATLLATWVFPVFRVAGASMAPTLEAGEIVIGVKGKNITQGSVIAFTQNNQVLIKRVEALGGQWVDINEGNELYIDGSRVEEPILTEKSAGIVNVEFPLQVPAGQYFVLGDNREVSVDSRSESVGCVAEERVIATLVFRVWPLEKFGFLQ